VPIPLRTVLLLALGAAVPGCGGGGGRTSTPTPSTTPDPRIPAGAAITVLNGETGAPVGGATVNVGGRLQTSDGAGVVRLGEPVPPGTPVDITAPGMLDRQTTLREAGTQFLWPKTTANGIDENYTATLVYTSAGRQGGPIGAQPLLRVALGATVAVVPSAEILGDDRAHDFHREAVEQLTAIVGGAVRFRLERTAPASGVVFTTRIEPGNATCAQNTRGFAVSNLRNSEIVGGEVVFCDDQIARSATVTHELGHTFGLRHSPDARDLMFGTFVRGRTPEFGPRETLIMNLMLKRPPGNRFPDSDRAAGAAAVTGRLTVVCD
jgi:hypothetical protein